MSNKKAKVVYTALRKISNERSFVYLAYQKWSESQDQIDFKADSIVDFVEQSVGLNANEKRNFRIALYALSSRSESDLLDVPDVLIMGQTTTTGEQKEIEKSHSYSPEEEGFLLFFGSLINESMREDDDAVEDLTDHLQDKKVIKQMKLGKSALIAIREWSDNENKTELNPKQFITEEMKAIIHQTYICLCETLGPVKADKVLNKSMTDVQQKSKGFNVNSLI